MMFGHYAAPERRFPSVSDPEWPAYVEACRVADQAERAYLAATEAASIAYERTYDSRESNRLWSLPPTCVRCNAPIEAGRPRSARVCDRHRCRGLRVDDTRCEGQVRGDDVLCGTHRYRETERVMRERAG